MRRWLSIATFGLILLALPAWAQRHGGSGGGAHFASHGGFAGHSSGGHSSGGHASGVFHGGGSFGHSSGIHVRTGNSFHNHRSFHGRRGYYPYFYPYAGYYPYGYYGWYNDPFFYDTETEDQDSYSGASYQAPSNPAANAENGGLQRDVQTLSGKIDRLQADVEARNRPKTESEPETALVFRDKHVEEIRNYAISGGTIWVLNDHQAGKKIPLAQLDLDATVKMNDDRGVDFQVPGPSLQLMIVR